MSSFWDQIKDMFTTTQTKKEKQAKAIADAVANETNIVNQLKALETALELSTPKTNTTEELEKLFPSDSGYSEKVYTPQTDEEIEKAAKEKVAYLEQVEKNNTESKYQTNLAAQQNTAKELEDNRTSSYQKLQQVYEALKQDAENDALKRGMARSSIITNKISDLGNSVIEGTATIEKSYNEKLGDINGKINTLNAELENALMELDLKYASQLTSEISSLKTERDNMVSSVAKENAESKQKDAAYQLKRESEMSDYVKAQEAAIAKAEKEGGYTGEKLDNYTKRYNIAADYYLSLSPDIAAAALEASPSMKYYLGNYYDQLLSLLQTRGSSTQRYY